MYHPPSKKKQITTRFLIYGLMTISVIGIVTILVLLMLGYRVDSQDGSIEQVGFMQYSSTPQGATIEVDGEALRAKTDAKGSVLPGDHEFVMWQEGYETWRKSLTIEAGTLTWLNYTRLIPKERPVEAVAQFDELSDILMSPGGRYAVAVTSASVPELMLFDLRSSTDIPQERLVLPASSYSESDNDEIARTFEIAEWDQGGRYILLTHTYGDQKEWLVVDRDDAERTRNISTSLNIDISDAQMSGTGGDIVYALSGGDVRKLDIASGTISRPYASNVATFELYGSNVMTYVSRYDDESRQRTVGFVREGDEQPHVLRTVEGEASVPLGIATSRYFNDDYIAISEGTRVDILRGSYPNEPDDVTSMRAYASFDFPEGVAWLKISSNGRFVLAQNAATFMSYDLERQTTSPVATIAGDGEARQLGWLDSYYVWSDRGGELVMREFDGANEHIIAPVARGFDAALSQNGTYLYSIGETESGGLQLQRTRLILE